MASLLERVGTLISANLNYLVSKAFKANSIAIVDEYIRKIEDNLQALEDAAATVGGEAKGMRRKAQEFQAKVEELDRSIDLFLRSNKEELARAAQSSLNTVQRLADTYHQQAASQETEFQKLLDAKLKLETKLGQVKQERIELQAMLDLAKSKETTHRVVVGVAGSTEAESGISEMRGEIQARLDKATAQSDMDATRLEHQAADVLEQDTLDAQLAERKRKLGMSS